MARRARMRRPQRTTPELNITAFLNLMVILVPFLLITAVFSHMTILELNLPPQNKSKASNKPNKKVLNFEVIIRKDKLVVADTIGGAIKSFRKLGDGFDLAAVSQLLIQLKLKFPDKQNITILMEPKVPYEILVQTMDVVRVFDDVDEDGEPIRRELFPAISIGDAPKS